MQIEPQIYGQKINQQKRNAQSHEDVAQSRKPFKHGDKSYFNYSVTANCVHGLTATLTDYHRQSG